MSDNSDGAGTLLVILLFLGCIIYFVIPPVFTVLFFVLWFIISNFVIILQFIGVMLLFALVFSSPLILWELIKHRKEIKLTISSIINKIQNKIEFFSKNNKGSLASVMLKTLKLFKKCG